MEYKQKDLNDLTEAINHYNQRGWVEITSYLRTSKIERGRKWLELMNLKRHELSDWKGISCVSAHSDILQSLYLSVENWDLSHMLLGTDTVYCFNDQCVVKNAGDVEMAFAPHCDNQFGTNTDHSIHTVNIMWILDDITEENGGLAVQDHLGWRELTPSVGSVVAVRGDIMHASGYNTSDTNRVLYACVFTDAPMNMDGYWNEEFADFSDGHHQQLVKHPKRNLAQNL